MPLIAKVPEGKEFTSLPAWQYPARCIWVIDLWTQTTIRQGVEKEKRKVRIMFEFPTELTVFKEENWEEPYVLSSEYTLSLSENWNLRPALESWRGKKFTDEELSWFDIEKLLWVPAYIQVLQDEKDWKTYSNINQILWLPKWLEIPAQINESKYFNTEEFDIETFNKLPAFIQEKIKKSKEYQKFDTIDWVFE